MNELNNYNFTFPDDLAQASQDARQEHGDEHALDDLRADEHRQQQLLQPES